jgi:hypothetical protein
MNQAFDSVNDDDCSGLYWASTNTHCIN